MRGMGGEGGVERASKGFEEGKWVEPTGNVEKGGEISEVGETGGIR